ncbi:MAG: radical SAM protein [Armatimonadetes bacterium]|nr:radical SAM protein [Armatimonadota bacterium]
MAASLKRIVYGPVPSWRLGRSLGVDMVSQAQKTCSFDCAYCQLGPTEHHTAIRREFVSMSRLVKELTELPALDLDYVTFSGTAEPTLAANLGEAISTVKEQLTVPVAVLTNSSFMDSADARLALARADKVVAKLDAPTEELLTTVNRPVAGITLERIVTGLRAFRQEYAGCFALQMMFYDANRGQAEALASLARELKPDEIELNTPLRPCAVKPLPPEALARIKQSFAGLPAVSVYEASRPAVRPLNVKETQRRRPEARGIR